MTDVLPKNAVRIASLTAELIELLRELPAEQRLDVFSLVKGEYCDHCGHEQPGRGSCQCWNDE